MKSGRRCTPPSRAVLLLGLFGSAVRRDRLMQGEYHGKNHQDAKDDCRDAQPLDLACLITLAIGNGLGLARFLEKELLLGGHQRTSSPTLSFDQLAVTEQKPLPTPLSFPLGRALLGRQKVLGAPRRVVVLDRRDQPVLGELPPGGPEPGLGAELPARSWPRPMPSLLRLATTRL